MALINVQKLIDANKPVLTKFDTANESITINGHPPTTKQEVYFVDIGDALVLSAYLVNEAGEIQDQIDQTALGYPPVLALPLMKYANGVVIDEVYFKATIVDGVISSSGDLPSKGNWKLTTERVNDSLKSIDADWEVSDAGFNFIVS